MNWESLKEKLKVMTDELSSLTKERNNYSRHYNSLLEKKALLKKEYLDCISLTTEKKNKLLSLHKQIKTRKEEWYNNGGTDDDFCLDVEGYKLLLTFRNLYSENMPYIKEEKEIIKNKLYDKEKTCDKLLEAIRFYDSKIKQLNKDISSLHLEERVKDYILLGKDNNEIYVEVQVNQISLKRKKVHFGHKRYYSKIDNVWYRVYDHSKRSILTQEQTNKLLNLIDDYLIMKSRDVIKN